MLARSVCLVLALLVGLGQVAGPRARGAPTTGRSPSVASLRADLDGDGAIDEVSLDRGGGVAVELTSGGGRFVPLQAPGRVERGAIVAAAGLVLVTAEIAGGEATRGEALALRVSRGAVEPVWRAGLGAAGDPLIRAVSLDHAGLRTWRERADLRRCDGAPAELDPEGWDPARGEMRPIEARVRVPEGAPRLVARRGQARRALAFRLASASSQLGAAPDDLAAASELVDGDPATRWTEGKAGFGRGELATVRALVPAGKVRAIAVAVGGPGQNRLRRAALLVGGRAFWLELDRDPARDAPGSLYLATLPAPLEADCVSLVIDRVWPAERAAAGGGDTAIGELVVLTDLELSPDGGAARLAALATDGGRGAIHAAHLLAELGPGGEAALVGALGSARGEGRRRVLAALAAVPAAPAALASGLSDRMPESERRALRAGLVKLGEAAVAPVASVLSDQRAAVNARVQAAEVLGALPGAGAPALIAALGDGPRAVRRAVSRAIGQRPTTEVPALLAALTPLRPARPGAEADLWRGLLALALRDAGARPTVSAAAAERLASAAGYELTARLVAGVPPLGDRAALAALESALAARRGVAPHEAIALERIAVAAMARGAGARAALRAHADAADPGVREEVIDGLAASAAAAEPRADAAVLAARLTTDRWPRVRRRAAAALAASCPSAPTGRAALERAIAGDADVEVRRVALGALVRCAPPGVTELVLRLAAADGEPAALRLEAIRLTAALGGRDPRVTDRMLALVDRLRAAAWDDEQARPLAAAALAALAARGDRRGIPALEAALADSAAFPRIQAAAAAALGAFCPPAMREPLGQLVLGGSPEVSVAARATIQRCWKRRR